MEKINKITVISVIIPMYNSSKTIIRSLESIVAQTYSDCKYEVVIVNDGSKDDSEQVVKNYIRNNDRPNILFKLINQANGGVSKARNTGISNSTGELIAFLDSDDQWHEEKVDLQIEFFKNEEVHFIATAFEEIFMSNRAQGELIQIPLKKLFYKNYFQPSTVMMRSLIVNDIGLFDESQRYAEEGNYFIRVASKYNCFFLNKKLLNYGDGKAGFGVSGLSANLREMEKGELKNLRYAYDNNLISFFEYNIACAFSIIKYVRRVLIVKLR